MARKSGNPNQQQRQVHQLASQHPGNPQNGPPPSTIPAQIIKSAANQDSRRKNSSNSNLADKTSFVEQVKEFLRKPELEDDDHVCSAFAFTITNGGLDPLFTAVATTPAAIEDPFTTRYPHLDEQGRVCLAALGSIFLQRSSLLFAPVHTEVDADATARPPIIVWLLPKLIGLLTLDNLSAIHEDVRSLLEVCVVALMRAADALHQVRSIVQMYRSCVQSE